MTDALEIASHVFPEDLFRRGASFFGTAVRSIRIETVDGRLQELALPNCPAEPSAVQAARRHGPGFATIAWKDGRRYSFGGRLQRAAVEVLWSAHQQGMPDVPERLILDKIESETPELRQLFRNHPAWGSLIQRSSLHGGPVGCYRLV